VFSGNEAYIHFYLNNYTDITSLSNAVRAIPYGGGNTNTTGGLRTVRTQIFNSANGDRSTVPNLCILITDGVPTREVDGLAAEVKADWDASIRIIGIGVTNAVSFVFQYFYATSELLSTESLHFFSFRIP
jgi:hypothetical protein